MIIGVVLMISMMMMMMMMMFDIMSWRFLGPAVPPYDDNDDVADNNMRRGPESRTGRVQMQHQKQQHQLMNAATAAAAALNPIDVECKLSSTTNMTDHHHQQQHNDMPRCHRAAFDCGSGSHTQRRCNTSEVWQWGQVCQQRAGDDTRHLNETWPHRLRWEPLQCRMPRYTPTSARRCLRHRHIVMIGDSRMRFLHLSLSYMLSHRRWYEWRRCDNRTVPAIVATRQTSSPAIEEFYDTFYANLEKRINSDGATLHCDCFSHDIEHHPQPHMSRPENQFLYLHGEDVDDDDDVGGNDGDGGDADDNDDMSSWQRRRPHLSYLPFFMPGWCSETSYFQGTCGYTGYNGGMPMPSTSSSHHHRHHRHNNHSSSTTTSTNTSTSSTTSEETGKTQKSSNSNSNISPPSSSFHTTPDEERQGDPTRWSRPATREALLTMISALQPTDLVLSTGWYPYPGLVQPPSALLSLMQDLRTGTTGIAALPHPINVIWTSLLVPPLVPSIFGRGKGIRRHNANHRMTGYVLPGWKGPVFDYFGLHAAIQAGVMEWQRRIDADADRATCEGMHANPWVNEELLHLLLNLVCDSDDSGDGDDGGDGGDGGGDGGDGGGDGGDGGGD